MPSAFPPGEPAPQDGSLPEAALDNVGTRPFSVYLHVPFCRVRCGYCDFNTYTATELGGGASQAAYADTARREIDLAADVLMRSGVAARPVSTVFVGGGTPTLLPADDLAAMLGHVRSTWGLRDGAEVTTEANPDIAGEIEFEAAGDDDAADKCNSGGGCDGGDEATPDDTTRTGEASTHRLVPSGGVRIAHSPDVGVQTITLATLATCTSTVYF